MSSKRVVFLDIDGVMNSLASAIAFKTYSKFDDVSASLLSRAAITVDAYFVLSSAWRICGSVEQCQNIFSARGYDVIAKRMIDHTDNECGTRGEQIWRWLLKNPMTEYVIIDDDADMLDDQLPRFIKTDHCYGFRLPEYVKLIELFKPDDVEARNLRKTLEWTPPNALLDNEDE